jgi:ribulose-phosphate 3-epimerase
MKIYPSLLAVFDKHGPEPAGLIAAALAAQQVRADGLHLDFMAPPFTQRSTFSPEMISQLRQAGVSMPLDVHLMTAIDVLHQLPLEWVNSLTFHPKMANHPIEVIEKLAFLQTYSVEGGIALDIEETVAPWAEVLAHPACRCALLMTVQAGAGGQPFQADMLNKINEIQKINPNLPIMIDGGITPQTLPLAAQAGAAAAVAGSAVFNTQDIEINMNNLRNAR